MQRLRTTPLHIDRLRFQNIVDIFSCLLFRLVRAIRRRYKSAIFVAIVRRSIQQQKKEFNHRNGIRHKGGQRNAHRFDEFRPVRW